MLGQLLREALDGALADLHVCLPGRVVSYDLATKTASIDIVVRRMVPRVDGEGLQGEAFPPLRGVPVCQAGAGGFAVHLPVTAGDFVWVHVSDVSLDKYRDVGKVVDAQDGRTHHLAHAWAVPVYDPAEMPTSGHATNLVIAWAGGEIHCKPDGTIALGVESPTSKAARDDLVEAELQALSDRIAVFERIFASWVVVPNDGGGALKTLYGADAGTPGASPGSVGSSKVKVAD